MTRPIRTNVNHAALRTVGGMNFEKLLQEQAAKREENERWQFIALCLVYKFAGLDTKVTLGMEDGKKMVEACGMKAPNLMVEDDEHGNMILSVITQARVEELIAEDRAAQARAKPSEG